jgi:hypothetical protein
VAIAAGEATTKPKALASRSVMLKARLTAKGVFDLRRRHASVQDGPYVVGVDAARAGELAEHPQRRAQRLLDRRRFHIGERRTDFGAIEVPQPRRGGVRGDAERAIVDLRDERRHQLPVTDGPFRLSAHRLVGEIACAVEVLAVERQLDGVGHRLPCHHPDHP